MVDEGDGEIESGTGCAAVVAEAQDDDALPLGRDADGEDGEHRQGDGKADDPDVDAAGDGEANCAYSEKDGDEQCS